MTSGGQCVMTPGTTLMLLWSASNWDMHTLEVRMLSDLFICGYTVFLQSDATATILFTACYCAATI